MDDKDILDIFVRPKPRRPERKAETEQQPITSPQEQKSGNGNPKLDALLKRADQLDALIAAEKMKQQKRDAVNRKRLALIVGGALLDNAEKSPDFKLTLKQALGSAMLDEASRKFLTGRGWI